ncbi:uncharacterized protein N7500_002809 [Penicillium coprophilum]|uniref:uncharacterized protein n=1 Tax=Penicillium coprophilum TaxID=36646 RepID=UPI0023864D67|nr:uncharacterized protein N7500_002809 [Penicillium coprophilum]KAJ5170026.1 hypothetical protein N7500_002809 [Penicillium coprophilum]
MHPTHNYRHSRRSACDRCRGQKLRCERDHMNGMSCERCIKAQEVCITSMNQPPPAVLPSNHGHSQVARDDCESQRFNQGHESMSILHKSSATRVKKTPNSPNTFQGRQNMKEHHYWGGVAPTPVFPEGNFLLSSGDIGLNMPMEFGNITSPIEQWGHHQTNWSFDGYNSLSDWMPSDQLYPYEANTCFPSPFTSNAPPGPRQATEMEIPQFFQAKNFIYGENESLFPTNDIPDPGWINHPTLSTTSKLSSITTNRKTLHSTQAICKSLLGLKMGLLEDLELFETGSMLLESSSLFYENSNLSIETLDLPIFRLLDHSSWLLAIVRSSCGTVEESLDDAFGAPRFQPDSSGYEDPCSFLAEGNEKALDEDITTASPHDSGYHTATTSPDPTMPPTIPKCDIALWLGMLEAHCLLVRIYRAVFMRLYQLFLIIPPVDAATILLLPKVRFEHFCLDGNLITQVQSLVDFSSAMMGKLDRVFKLRPCPTQLEKNRGFDLTEPVRQKDWSTSIRDIVLAQQEDPCEMSLMELMERLRQLVKDPLNI